MWRIARFEGIRSRGCEGVSTAESRAYWNERVDDTMLSGYPPGTAGFYAALDAYRLEKSGYLLDTVDFAAWAGRDVLEVGCGAGLDLVRFARAGARVTGVDVARTAIELTAGYCRVAGVEARLIEADGARLPLPSGSFDLVYCMAVLPFAEDPAAIVAEAHRVLRPGGQAIFMAYNRRSWMTWLARLRGSLGGHSDAPTFRLYDARELDRLLAPFPERRLVTERFPAASERHQGLAGAVFDRGLVPALGLLPRAWLRPYGWHLLAFCRKQD
jgi:SAM-dependent methyltransferase